MTRRAPAVVAALFFWGAGANAAETARVDACSLLTAADVSAVVGAKVDAGERNDSGEVEGGGFSSTCVWKVTGSAPASADPDKPFGGAAFAMLNTIAWPAGSGKARKYLADFYQAAKDNLIDNQPVPVKAGDDALWWGDGVAVRKGDISFGVSAHVGTDKKQEQAMEEALARRVAGRL
jgi:hypothetical protein